MASVRTAGGQAPAEQDDLPRALMMIFLGTAVTVGMTSLFIVAGSRRAGEVLVGLLALVSWCVVCVVDLDWLPSVALVGFAILPLSYLPLPTHDGLLNLADPVLVMVLIRCVIANRRIPRTASTLPLILLLLWVVVATLLSPEKSTSAAWSVPFLLLVGIPGLLLPGWTRATERLKSTWIILGGILGGYGLIEFILERNLIYGRYFTGLNGGGSLYRITTTLGHPITNGLFFTLATLLGAGALARGRRGFVIPCTLLALIATVLSFSRGPFIGLIIGMAVLVVHALLSGRVVLTRRRLLVGVSVLAIAAGGGDALTSLRGAAGQSSTSAHLQTLQTAGQLVSQYFPLGGGPGLADAHKRLLPSGNKTEGVESSVYQVAISLGLPGIVLMLWLLMSAGRTAWKVQPEIAACVITYIACTAAYNGFEADRPALILLGSLLALSHGPGDPEPTTGGLVPGAGRPTPSVGSPVEVSGAGQSRALGSVRRHRPV